VDAAAGAEAAGAADAGASPGADAAPVLVAVNSAATAVVGSVSRGSAAFLLPPASGRAALFGLRFLTHGDSPPGPFGGAMLSVALWRGRPFQPRSVRVAGGSMGACPPGQPQPCWTGPDFQPPVEVEAGEKDLWVGLDNVNGEGGALDLPVGAGPLGQVQESWALGQIRWGRGSPGPLEYKTWTRAPEDLPWVFQELGQPRGP
jgi:hypothetical protein